MKEKEAKVEFKDHQLVLYVERRDGTYGPVQTGSYISKNYIDDFWHKRKNLEQECLEKIRKNEISPIAFYMMLEELTPSELASRVKLSARKVRRHMHPNHFGEITIDQLKRYCDVFNVPIVNMFQAVMTKKKNLILREDRTDNPLFILLTIEEGKK